MLSSVWPGCVCLGDSAAAQRELQAQRMQTKNAEVNALRRTLVQSGLVRAQCLAVQCTGDDEHTARL
jgi:hypothetical protein